jgi:hypothetical protein
MKSPEISLDRGMALIRFGGGMDRQRRYRMPFHGSSFSISCQQSRFK